MNSDMIWNWILDKYHKAGQRLDRGWIGRTVTSILNDPQAGWTFLTLVLLVGGFGVFCCLMWFYLLIQKGMEWYWILFDSAIVLFCLWAVIWGIIPMAREAYKDINKKREDDGNNR